MTTTVRLPQRVEEALAVYCVQTRRTKSEVIVTLLEQQLLSKDSGASTFELASAAGFIGCVDGEVDTAANAKKLVRRKIRAKHSR